MCRIVSLTLKSNNLVGQIPQSLGHLNALESLDLSYNRLEGDIGSLDFGRFPAFHTCILSSNLLAGSFPVWLLNVSSVLQNLQLAGNRLTGSLPSWIDQLSSVHSLDLRNNSLSGTLPLSLASMSGLSRISLTGNAHISGRLPSNIGNLKNLIALNMGSMNLSGTLPTSICDLVTLRDMTLGTNAISGTIPCDLERLVHLETFNLQYNRLDGTIPDSLFSAVNLSNVFLNNNLFSGSLSSRIGSALNLNIFDVTGNMLTGQIPSAISKLSWLYQFNVSFNQLEGLLPDKMASSRLVTFDASSNRLSGSLPLWLGSLKTLTAIKLDSNQFSGRIPSNLCSPDSSLVSIDLSNNFLTSFDAISLFSCPLVATLDLSRNRIRQSFDFQRLNFLPPLINISHNELGPQLSEFSVPLSGFSVSVIDIRSNMFLCPYPSNFPLEIALLFSPCAQPWSKLLVYAAIFVGSIIALLGIFLLLVRFVSALANFASHSSWIAFVVSWIGDCVGLVLDMITLQIILSYLAASIDHCVGINYYGYFAPLTLILQEDASCLPDPSRKIQPFPSLTTLLDFFSACRAVGSANVPDLVLESFPALCARTLPQCDFDPAMTTCRTFYPELDSDARGEVHRFFFGVVIAVATVRVIIELARLACVFAAYRRMSNLVMPVDIRACVCSGTAVPVYWMAELVGTSIASPLLYFASRAEFVALHLQREPSAGDFAFRALHAGLLTSVPLLGVNMWYLLRVAQYGLAPAGWLSLMKGLVLVPRLLFQAYRATRPGAGKHQRSSSDAAFHIDAETAFELAFRINPKTAFDYGDDAAVAPASGAAVADAGGSVRLLELHAITCATLSERLLDSVPIDSIESL